MHVYVWENIVSNYYRTAKWMFMKLRKDEMLIAPHMHYGGGEGSLLQETSSDRKATTIDGMYNNYLEACRMKCCYFFVRFWSQIFKFQVFIVLRWATVALRASCYMPAAQTHFYAPSLKGLPGASSNQIVRLSHWHYRNATKILRLHDCELT